LQKPAPADQLIVAAIYVIPAPPPAYDAERVVGRGQVRLHFMAQRPFRADRKDISPTGDDPTA